MKLTITVIILLVGFKNFCQETAYFDRIFNKISIYKDVQNKRLYIVKDSVIEIEDYKRKKIYRKGKFYGFIDLKNLDKFIRHNASNQYHKPDSLITDNRYGIVDYYNKREKLRRREYYHENSTKYIQVWDEKGEPLLTNGSGVYTKNYPLTNEKFFQIFKDSSEVESYYVRDKQKDTVFYKVDKKAYPKEGLKSFYKTLANSINYPGFAQSLGIKKKVTIQFIVDEYGKLTEFVPISHPNYNFEKQSIKKLKQMPNWNPAILNGKTVKTRFRIPITFRLN